MQNVPWFRVAGRAKGVAAQKAQSMIRWHKLQDASDEGHSLIEAAEMAKMKPDSAKALIRKMIGNFEWPITKKRIIN